MGTQAVWPRGPLFRKLRGLGGETDLFPPAQAIFDKFDRDASGTMNSHELRLALNAAGLDRGSGVGRGKGTGSPSSPCPPGVPAVHLAATTHKANTLTCCQLLARTG